MTCSGELYRLTYGTKYGHIARMSDESDAKQILTASPLELEETTWTPPYYVDEDYPAGPEINEPLPERSNWRGSESPTLESGDWCLHLALRTQSDACQKWMNEWLTE